MLTANLWTEAGLVNGSCGMVDNIVKPEDDCNMRIIMVDFPTYCGPCVSPSRPNVILITQIHTSNQNGLPLMLTWAITIHKSQGMTLDQVTVDLGCSKFISGLMFIVLSCVKMFRGLRIKPFDFAQLKCIECGKHMDDRHDEFDCLHHLADTNNCLNPANPTHPSSP